MTHEHKQPFVMATVLNYNGWEDAAECVRSLLSSSYANLKIVVIDNCSTDNSVNELTKLVDGNRVQLVQTDANLGSVGGTAFATRYALKSKADFIFALSNDLAVPPDTIEILVNAMLSDPGLGVLSPKIMYYRQPDRIWSCGFLMNHWLARGTDLVNRVRRSAHNAEILDVDMLIGGVMFLRRALLEQVGFVDERYFFQNEEYEYFDRIRKGGWRVKVAMNTSVLHKVGQTIGTESYDRWYYGTRNRLLYIRESLPLLQRITAKLFFYGTRPIKSCQWLFKGKADLIRATFEGWRDYRRCKLGKRLSTGDVG